MSDEWTAEMLLAVIQRSLEQGDMEAVAIALKVLAVKAPHDAQAIVDALEIAGSLP